MAKKSELDINADRPVVHVITCEGTVEQIVTSEPMTVHIIEATNHAGCRDVADLNAQDVYQHAYDVLDKDVAVISDIQERHNYVSGVILDLLSNGPSGKDEVV